jgi:hypothetical protein
MVPISNQIDETRVVVEVSAHVCGPTSLHPADQLEPDVLGEQGAETVEVACIEERNVVTEALDLRGVGRRCSVRFLRRTHVAGWRVHGAAAASPSFEIRAEPLSP